MNVVVYWPLLSLFNLIQHIQLLSSLYLCHSRRTYYVLCCRCIKRTSTVMPTHLLFFFEHYDRRIVFNDRKLTTDRVFLVHGFPLSIFCGEINALIHRKILYWSRNYTRDDMCARECTLRSQRHGDENLFQCSGRRRRWLTATSANIFSQNVHELGGVYDQSAKNRVESMRKFRYHTNTQRDRVNSARRSYSSNSTQATSEIEK